MVASDGKTGGLFNHGTVSPNGLSRSGFPIAGGDAWSFMGPASSFDPGAFGPPVAVTIPLVSDKTTSASMAGVPITGTSGNDTSGISSSGIATSGISTSGISTPDINTSGAVTTARRGLTINVSYASDAQAYSGFTSLEGAVNSAVGYLESLFTDNITINISIGWGTLGDTSTPVPTNAVGASASNGITEKYASLYSALQQNAATSPGAAAALANLPATDPTNGGTFYIPDAQAKALGISAPGGYDGCVGLSTTQNYTFDQTGTIASGSFDAVGVLEHEITEIMGRIESLGSYDASDYTLMDLYRYSSPGVRDLTPGPGSFSVDGTTLLKAFNNPANGGDAGDWANSGGVDAFNNAATTGTVNPVSATDLQLMNVLGYAMACFAAGTRLAGAHGEIAVEHLQPGDLLHARFAGLARVKWIGHRRIDCARHPDPLSVLPVRIAPDAFGPGLPRRNLLLSPEHAVAVDDALIPIRLLLNGGSIAQQETRHIHYFHVELDRHDLLHAEGMLAESYLDTGNRHAFANANANANASQPLALHPVFGNDQARRLMDSCLKLLLDPADVEPVWRRLAQRAEAIGFVLPRIDTTTDPAACLAIGDRLIRPIAAGRDHCCFLLPADARQVRLLSRSTRPATVRPWLDDRRLLGLMVRGITLHGVDGPFDMAMDDPRLQLGWWAPERDAASLWRWTNGDATVPIPFGIRMLALRLGPPLAYPRDADIPAPGPGGEPALRPAIVRAA